MHQSSISNGFCRATLVVMVIHALSLDSSFAQDCGSPVDFGFSAHSWTSSFAVDCSIAVGSNGIVATTNDGLWLFDRDGNELDDHRTLIQFFGGAGGVDTLSAFDTLSERYFVLTMQSPDFILAVSKTSEPTLDPEDWYFHEFTNLPGGNPDFPCMSVGEDYVYVSWARVGGGPPQGTAYIASATKSDLLSGETPTVAYKFVDQIDGQTTSPQFRAIGCVKMYSQPSSSMGLFITDSHKTSGVNTWVRLYALDASTNTLYSHDLTVPDYFTAPIKINSAGTDGELTCHWDFKFPVYRNGSMWAAHAIGPEEPEEEPKTAKVRWYEIDMNGWPLSQNDPELVQSGTIDPNTEPNEGISAFYPAIHVDDDGNIAIAYNQSSASEHVSIQRSIRKHYDDLGELRSPLVIKQSQSSPAGSNPWADYSAMDEDPDFPGVMWSHLMWFEGTSTRKTWITRTDLNQSLPLVVSPETDPLLRGTYVTCSVTGAAPGGQVRWYYSVDGCGSTYIPILDVTLDIDTAVLIGLSTANSSGTPFKSFTIPNDFPLGPAHLQAAEYQNASSVVEVTVSSQ